jgi:hypothetical protein
VYPPVKTASITGPEAFEFDSYMKPTEDLEPGSMRLLEVTRRMQIPLHASIQALITADDVIHS